VCVCVHVYVCVYTCMCLCVHVYVVVCVRVYMVVCVRVDVQEVRAHTWSLGVCYVYNFAVITHKALFYNVC
jgi:hypothetical protein